MATPEFAVGSLVFAKMKFYPYWPAKVTQVIPGKPVKYNIFFYGSHDTAKVTQNNLSHYNEGSKWKYGNENQRRRGGPNFIKGLTEIELTETEDTTDEEDAAAASASLKGKGSNPERDQKGTQIQLYIEGFASTETFVVGRNALVDELLGLISKRMDIPVVNLRMIHESLELEPGNVLGFYKVRDGSRIYVRLYIEKSQKFSVKATKPEKSWN